MTANEVFKYAQIIPKVGEAMDILKNDGLELKGFFGEGNEKSLQTNIWNFTTISGPVTHVVNGNDIKSITHNSIGLSNLEG